MVRILYGLIFRLDNFKILLRRVVFNLFVRWFWCDLNKVRINILRKLFVLLEFEVMIFFLRFFNKGININLKLSLISFDIKLSSMVLEVFLMYFKVSVEIFFNFDGLFLVELILLLSYNVVIYFWNDLWIK